VRIAVTGGTGFVGRHLAARLAGLGHEVVLVARGVDQRPGALAVRETPGVTVVPANVADEASLRRAFEGCDAVAHCAGVNREVGQQTYDAVHVAGTRNVVAAAEAAGVQRLTLLSFLRARPACGSPYHESKWRAEEIVRGSSLRWTVLKPGMVYGSGDHFLDHLSRALFTSPSTSASANAGSARSGSRTWSTSSSPRWSTAGSTGAPSPFSGRPSSASTRPCAPSAACSAGGCASSGCRCCSTNSSGG
jgi:nucleoside-diphosphate-sugar epimerase